MTLLGKIFQEAAYATRNLFRARSFAIVVILTLALGIGVNTSGLSATQNASIRVHQTFREVLPCYSWQSESTLVPGILGLSRP